MVKNYKLASLTTLLTLCSGIHAMENSNLDEKKHFALKMFVSNMKKDPNSIIKIMDIFDLKPNEILPDIFLKKYKTSILGHVIITIYKQMETNLYHALTTWFEDLRIYQITQYEKSKILLKPCVQSGSGKCFYEVFTKEAKKVKSINKENQTILRDLFDRKGDLDSFELCESQVNTDKINIVNPMKILSILMKKGKLSEQIRSKVKSIPGHYLVENAVVPFDEIMLEKNKKFIDKIEELSKANNIDPHK